MLQYLINCARQVGYRFDCDHRTGRSERIRDIPKVLHVRTDYDWLTEHRRLKDIVSTAWHDGTAHEYDVGAREAAA